MLPTREDTVFNWGVKGAAVAARAIAHFQGSGYLLGSLVERRSLPFVQLFFASSLANSLPLRRYPSSNGASAVLEYTLPEGRVCFLEWDETPVTYSREFYTSPGVSVRTVVDRIWQEYENGCFFEFEAGGRPPLRVSALSAHPARLSSFGTKRVESYLARAEAARVCLCVGPPGTGKTLFARSVAATGGGRLLKLDVVGLEYMGIQELRDSLDLLRPRYLLLDDFDRAPIEEVRARILYLFEELHHLAYPMQLFVTVNDASALDAAFLRPGRIDTVLSFGFPDDAERAEFWRQARSGLLESEFVERTRGFSHADLAALIAQLRRLPPADAFSALEALVALRGSAGDGASAPQVRRSGRREAGLVPRQRTRRRARRIGPP